MLLCVGAAESTISMSYPSTVLQTPHHTKLTGREMAASGQSANYQFSLLTVTGVIEPGLVLAPHISLTGTEIMLAGEVRVSITSFSCTPR